MLVKNHFEDCPYGCNEKGLLLDTNTGNMIQCPHCSKIKKDLLLKGEAVEEASSAIEDLSILLGIKSKYITDKLVFESIISKEEMSVIEPESINSLKEKIEELYKMLSIGDLPEQSYCFGLGSKGNIDKLAYPLLSKSYISGLTVAKFITCGEFSRILMVEEGVDEYYSADIVVMLIQEGSTKADISSAKGLMQARGLKGLSTIFITTWDYMACRFLCSKMEPSLLLAEPVFAVYKVINRQKNHIHGITGLMNEVYKEEPQGYSLGEL